MLCSKEMGKVTTISLQVNGEVVIFKIIEANVAKVLYCTFDLRFVMRQIRLQFIVYLILSDMRKGFCYTMVFGGPTCKNSVHSALTKKTCCCYIGKAWGDPHGDPCQPCPYENTRKRNNVRLYLDSTVMASKVLHIT